MNPETDIPKHHKKAGKKLFAVKWTWTGDKTKLKNRLQEMLHRDRIRRYATARGATDALVAWQNNPSAYPQHDGFWKAEFVDA